MESRKAVAKYERVLKRLPYGEEEPYGAYEAPIPDYVMLASAFLRSHVTSLKAFIGRTKPLP